MLKKYKFIIYLLRLFSSEPIKTKIYLIVRIIIFPLSFLDIISKQLKTSNLIDVGCGFGIASIYLNYIGYNKKILGIDIDKNRIDSLNETIKNDNISFKQVDLIKDGFKDLAGYNSAVLADILHHLDNKTQYKLLDFFASNINELYIKDIDIFPKYKYYWNYFHDRYLMGNEILCFEGSKKIKSYLEKLGYKVEYRKIFSIFPYPHYLLIAKK